MRWMVGVTTVPSRKDDLLPRTLKSLKAAGFDSPTLFVDGASNPIDWYKDYSQQVVCRYPTIKTFGNWILGMWEMYLRDPNADRYVMFQDDLVSCRGLKRYLERTTYRGKRATDAGARNGPADEKHYYNLYTFPQNQELAPKTVDGGTVSGWYRSNQMGRGAVGLVFSVEALLALLSSTHMVERPMDVNRGWRCIDGGIVTAMIKAGYSEMVHSPSLLQHTGALSSMGNQPHPLANSFLGEEWDATSLIAAAGK